MSALWTVFFARVFSIRLSPLAALALGLAVWLLYAADRIHDGLQDGVLEERHRFHLRHRRTFMVAMLSVFPLFAVLLSGLPPELCAAWVLLSVPLILYLVLVHGLRVPRMPKEAVVGIFFGSAVAMPCITMGGTSWRSLFPGMLLFAALCWFNGIVISRWEPLTQHLSNPCTLWLARRTNLAGIFLALASAVQFMSHQSRPVALAVLFSTGLLLLLDRKRTRFSPVHLRALADAALLSPLVIWPLMPLLSR